MFEYEWGNPSLLLPPSGDTDDGNHHRHPGDGYSTGHVDTGDIQSFISPTFLPFQHPNNHHYHHHHHNNSLQTIMDPRAFPSASFSPTAPSMLSSNEFDSFLTLPKPEPGPVSNSTELDRIGLNLGLGGRTYFSAADEDFLTRLYRRSRPFDGGSLVVNSPKCQAEGCNADLSNAKHYHRRHKVCEFHSKAATVVAGGLTQRFCQQCSRFHLLTEFDNGKRSCRRRLADHNRRRRKSHQTTAGSHDRRSENPPRSPSESSRAHSISSVTVAVSSPMEDSIPTCYNSAPSPSISPTSIFY